MAARLEEAVALLCASTPLHIPAQVDLEPEFRKHGGFDAAAAVGLFAVGRIDDLDVVGLVPSHHLVAADAVEDRVHDRPLRSSLAPPTLGFFLRQLYHLGNAKVAMKPAVH